MLAFVIFLVLVVIAGVVYQGIASAVDASTYPPPGRMVDVGGYRLHVHCTGSGGPNSYSRCWQWWLFTGLESGATRRGNLHAGLFLRPCGLWLERLRPHTSHEWAYRARIAHPPRQRGHPRPYVLVGHSFGGLNMRLLRLHLSARCGRSGAGGLLT